MFTETNFKKAPTYSDREIGQLNKVDVAWANLGQKIQMAMGHFTSKHGMQMVGDLSKITTEVIKLADSLATLAEKLQIFKLIGTVFKGWDLFIKSLNTSVETITNMGDYKSGATGEKGVMSWMKDATHNDLATLKNLFGDGFTPERTGVYEKTITPPVKAQHPPQKTQNINVQQTLQFQHDGKDAKKTGASVNKAVKDAYRQMQAQGQGS